MSLIRNDVTKQNGRCSVGTLVCAPMELVNDCTNSKVFESAEDHGLIVLQIKRLCIVCLRVKYPRTIIYCQRCKDCADIFLFFQESLGINVTEPPNAPIEVPRFRMVDMFMSCTEEYVKEQIIRFFSEATVAFGMGIDCYNVTKIIHMLPPSSVESYVQETGCATAILFHTNKLKHLDKSLQCYVCK